MRIKPAPKRGNFYHLTLVLRNEIFMKLVDTLAAAFDIRPEERLATLLLLMHSCFVGMSIAFFFTAANALFLAEFGSEILPIAYFISAVTGALLGLIFSKIDKRFSFSGRLIANLIFLIGSVIAFRVGFAISTARWLSFGLFILITPFVSFLYIEFWGLAGRLFNLRQAKRLFGLVGTGEVVTSLLAYLSIPVIVNFMGTVNLLFISGGSLFLSDIRGTIRRISKKVARSFANAM